MKQPSGVRPPAGQPPILIEDEDDDEDEKGRSGKAIGLHRKWTPSELRHLLGRRIWRELGPNRIRNHDAEDPDGIVELGRSRIGTHHNVAVLEQGTEGDRRGL